MKHPVLLSYDAGRTVPKTSICFRKPYLIIFGFLCFFYISLPSSAQKQRPTNDIIVERLNSLERENQRLREDITELKSENEELKSNDKELEAAVKEYEPLKNGIWILGIFGIGSAAGLLFLYFKFIPGKINSQVDIIIKKILTDRRDDFLGLLKQYDFEKEVKQRYRIVLLSHRSGSDDYHYKMLEKNGFNVTAFTNLSQLQEADFTPEDILVINNDGNHWPDTQVQAFINDHPNYCFYFGKGFISPEGDSRNRFAAASFRTQFIGNLMNALKYSHHQN
jgi:hypothetical protein